LRDVLLSMSDEESYSSHEDGKFLQGACKNCIHFPCIQTMAVAKCPFEMELMLCLELCCTSRHADVDELNRRKQGSDDDVIYGGTASILAIKSWRGHFRFGSGLFFRLISLN